MELIISGYGEKPNNTIAHYSVMEQKIQVLWNESVENAGFVCKGDGYLFTITEVSDYSVVYLFRQQGTGYRLLDYKKIEGGSLCHITYSSKNKALFGACYETGTVFSVRVEESRFGELLYHEIQQGENPSAITRVHSVTLNRDETELIVLNIALDRCYFYDILEGSLTLQQILEIPKGTGPRHCLLSEDESLLYIITEYSNEILVYENGQEKRLLQRISTLSENYNGISNCSTLCFSKDFRFIYAANRGVDTIAVFCVNPDGTLVWDSEYDCGGEHPRHMIITKDGGFLIVCNQYTDNVSVFLLDAKSGALKQRSASIGFHLPSGILEI